MRPTARVDETIESFPLCSADGASFLKTGDLPIFHFFFAGVPGHKKNTLC